MTLPKTWSSFIWTWPTATPRHRTFLSWNLMVERTSVILLLRSSAWATGVGNLPAVGGYKKGKIGNAKPKRTLGQTGSQQTGNLLDQRLRGEESVVFLGELLDQLLVLVQSNTDDDEHLVVPFERTRKEKTNALLQIVHRHVFELNLLGPIDVSSIGENADRHPGAGDIGESK